MNRTRFLIMPLVISLTLLAEKAAQAGGFGPFVSYGQNRPTISGRELFEAVSGQGLPASVGQDVHLDWEIDHVVVGLMVDSAPYRAAGVNHNLTLGMDIASKTRLQGVEIPGIDTSGFNPREAEGTGYGIAAKYTLGIGLIRSEIIRWWIGPSAGATYTHYNDIVQYLDGSTSDAWTFVGGGGGETGINLHLGSAASLVATGGVHYAATALNVDRFENTKWGDGPFFFFQVAMLFHTGADAEPFGAVPVTTGSRTGAEPGAR